jgi:hypothetical protein
MTHAFCSSLTTKGRKYHIRKLDSDGYRFQGGVTTSSLCGFIQPGDGYDISLPITSDELLWCCPKCRDAYKVNSK